MFRGSRWNSPRITRLNGGEGKVDVDKAKYNFRRRAGYGSPRPEITETMSNTRSRQPRPN